MAYMERLGNIRRRKLYNNVFAFTGITLAVFVAACDDLADDLPCKDILLDLEIKIRSDCNSINSILHTLQNGFICCKIC